MPRPPRIHVEGALYYVTSRALEPNVLFRDRLDYETYLTLLNGYQAQFGFKLFAYVLLPNQLHLCLELAGSTTISAIMHALTSRYTKYVNKRYGHAGHLFQERFKSTLLEKELWLVRLTGYLHILPQRCGVTGEMTDALLSSYGCYLASTGSSIGPSLRGEVEEALARLAQEHPGMSYEIFIRSTPAEVWEQIERELCHPVVGSAAFVAMAQARAQRVVRQSAGPTQPASCPPGSRRATAPVLTGSVAVAVLSLGVAVLYAHHVTALRHPAQGMAQERTPASAQTTATLASWVRPSNLAGTIWQVQVKPMYAAGDAHMQSDELQFGDRTVISSTLSAHGFSGSNYSLTIQPTGAVLWETMQTGQNHEVICWRGEWDGQAMHGVMTRQLPGQPTENFAFVGSPKNSDTARHARET